MKGFVIYSTKTGEKIAEDLSFGSENLFSVAAKENFTERAMNENPDFIIFEECAAAKGIFALIQKLRWNSYRIVSTEVISFGETLRFDIFFRKTVETLFEEYETKKQMLADDFTDFLRLKLEVLKAGCGADAAKKFLRRIGLFPNLEGYHMLIDAVKLALAKKSMLLSVTTELYPAIAKIRGVSVRAVERDIRNAITVAFNKGKVYREMSAYGVNFDHNEKPTNSEFIAFLSTIC